MKCTLIYRGSGLLGPLVNIREDYNSRCTSIFKDKLGLFHLASQRGRSRSIHSCSWYTALSSCFLLIFYFSFYTSNIYTKKDSGSPYPRVSGAPAVSSVSVVAQSSGAAEKDEGMSTCLPPLFPAARPAGCQCAEEIEMQLVLFWL